MPSKIGITNIDTAFNESGTALANAARTITVNSSDITNKYRNGVQVILDVTAIANTPNIVLKISGKCPVSGKYYMILEGASISSTGTTIYTIFPEATAVGYSVVPNIMPKTWRVTVTHTDTDSITYSVGYNLS